MQSSEKKSLYRFLLIYTVSTLTLFAIGAVIFYQFQMYQIQEKERRILKHKSEQMIDTIRMLHKSSDRELIYPNDPALKTAIYNIDREYIFGSFRPEGVEWNKMFSCDDKHIRHMRSISPYYFGVAYLVTEKLIDKTPIHSLQKILMISVLGVTLFILILSYFLGRLFIAPMRDSLKRINMFVQDTTHELNTPISTILTNIEMLEILGKCKENKEMKRIEIASKTLSHIYDDLTYLKLNQNYQRHPESMDMSALLKERIGYFATMMEMKQIELEQKITPNIIKSMDPSDSLRLFDNLISNAIKYNDIKGRLEIIMDDNVFSIQDTGRGMSKQAQSHIFDRFARMDKSEGGFGIGLDIVSQVVEYYDFKITIDSKESEGTTVSVLWNSRGKSS